ncbi:hypothetical protein ALC60_03888 [Trachymyrmex zeteki]|uniref:Endonuclease/exonuclease/phosphatase domain-containing protein n=1 Tax=Mycetomoellerius zeteki TaxID=64791 RepID=A0A151X9W9_9HYME|nr:hypothetical protein ALC60_03888 [Trachymyrmex zeteki]
MGDFNARAPAWDPGQSNRRGRILINWMGHVVFQLLNVGTEPTCVHPRGASCVDITPMSWNFLTKSEKIIHYKILNFHVDSIKKQYTILLLFIVFKYSGLQQKYNDNSFDNKHLIGDSAYTLQKSVMYCTFSTSSTSCHTPYILRRKFALTSTAYKYLDIGISVGLMSYVKIVIGDNRGNRIILPHTTWKTFIERRANVERLVQSTVSSSLKIQDLIVELVKIGNEYNVKISLNGT